MKKERLKQQARNLSEVEKIKGQNMEKTDTIICLKKKKNKN